VLHPFRPTFVAESKAAPATTRAILRLPQQHRPTHPYMRSNATRIDEDKQDKGPLTCRSRGGSPLRVRSCACTSHIAATAAASRASETLHLPGHRGDSAVGTRGSSSSHAMAPYSGCTGSLRISHTSLSLQVPPWLHFDEQDPCNSLRDIKAEALSTWGRDSKSSRPEGSVVPGCVAP
jgi:hypothetical protein